MKYVKNMHESAGAEVPPFASEFETVTDDDMLAILDAVHTKLHALADVRQRPPHGVRDLEVAVDIDHTQSTGELAVPARALGLVLFAHDSGSTQTSAYDRVIASALRRGGVGTLLFDLLAGGEKELDRRDAHLRFNVDVLAPRLVAATDWVRRQPELRGLALGYFGVGTGAAAALVAATERPDVRAVVSLNGRLELAAHGTERVLERTRAPTLLIVGGADPDTLAQNRAALPRFGGPKRLEVIAGATHLLEGAGARESAAELTSEWLTMHLGLAALEAHA